ncbi:MAG: SRPBCC domain-containing protein [Acidobacteriota bacterium]
MTAAIERTVELDAKLEDVWRALTDPTEVSGWFGDSASFTPEIGASGWFGWEKHGRFSMRVEAFEPPTRFAWRWSRDPGTDIDEGVSTLVEWTLREREDGGTTLELRESGFVREQDREMNSGGWDEELEHLRQHLLGS